jgi:hypothetical protein
MRGFGAEMALALMTMSPSSKTEIAGSRCGAPSVAGCGAPPYRVLSVELKFGKVATEANLFFENSMLLRNVKVSSGLAVTPRPIA